MDWTAFRVSLELALWTCVLILPIGVMIARILAWKTFYGKSLVEALILLPLVLPPTVLGFYLLVSFGPSAPLGATIKSLTGETVVFSFTGILFASLIVNLPFAVQPMQRAFEGVPANVREAAWVSGLSSFETFRRIELPMTWPGLVSAMALVFAHTLGEFGVILMIGGNIPGETQTLSIAIYDRVQAFREGEASIIAAVLLAFSFVAIAIVLKTTKPRGP